MNAGRDRARDEFPPPTALYPPVQIGGVHVTAGALSGEAVTGNRSQAGGARGLMRRGRLLEWLGDPLHRTFS